MAAHTIIGTFRDTLDVTIFSPHGNDQLDQWLYQHAHATNENENPVGVFFGWSTTKKGPRTDGRVQYFTAEDLRVSPPAPENTHVTEDAKSTTCPQMNDIFCSGVVLCSHDACALVELVAGYPVPRALVSFMASTTHTKSTFGVTASLIRRLNNAGISLNEFVDVVDLDRGQSRLAVRKTLAAISQQEYGLELGFEEDMFPLWQPGKVKPAALEQMAVVARLCFRLLAADPTRFVGMIKKASIPCPVKCCERFFAVEKALEHHRKVSHYDPDQPHPRTCTICRKSFKTETSLTQHVESAHPADSKPDHPYSLAERGVHCNFNQCKQTFSSLDAANTHFAKYHPGAEVDVMFGCAGCKKLFPARSSLDMHFNVIHSSDKRYPCCYSGCSSIYETQEALKQHRKVTGHVLDHLCGMCGASFPIEAELTEHFEESQHKRCKKCTQCNRIFVSHEALERHQQSSGHEGMFEFQQQVHESHKNPPSLVVSEWSDDMAPIPSPHLSQGSFCPVIPQAVGAWGSMELSTTPAYYSDYTPSSRTHTPSGSSIGHVTPPPTSFTPCGHPSPGTPQAYRHPVFTTLPEPRTISPEGQTFSTPSTTPEPHTPPPHALSPSSGAHTRSPYTFEAFQPLPASFQPEETVLSSSWTSRSFCDTPQQTSELQGISDTVVTDRSFDEEISVEC